jgi:hypothetical protein
VPFRLGGRTVRSNLAVLCKHHDRVKHLSGWACGQGPDGTLTFVSPHGLVRRTRPPTADGAEPPVSSGCSSGRSARCRR